MKLMKECLIVMQSAQFINGPEVQNFQKELEQYLGVKHVIPCANGTDALQIALMALRFGNLVMRLLPQISLLRQR